MGRGGSDRFGGDGNGVYGSIYISLGSTTQATNASADTFDLMTGWNTTEGANGLSNGTTPAKASNKITLDKAGTYEVKLCLSFVGSTPVAVYTCQAFLGGSAQVQCTGDRETAATDVGSMVFCGRVTATAGQDLDVRVASNTTSDNFTPLSASLMVTRVGN